MNIQCPQSDQTLESLAVESWLFNGGKGLKEFLDDLRSRKRARSPIASVIPSKLFAQTGGGGYATADHLLTAHSFLPLFKPFSEPAVYSAVQAAVAAGTADPATRRFQITRSQLVREIPCYCAECAVADLAKNGYAYARRMHQVLGVENCQIHDALLRLPAQSAAEPLARWGILFDSAALCSPAEAVSSGAHEDERRLQRRFGHFVRAALQMRLPTATAPVRRNLFWRRLQSAPQIANEPRSFPRRLERYVAVAARSEWLRRMSLHPSDSRSRWPAYFATGLGYQEDPLVGLLLSSMLFDDPNEYALAVSHMPPESDSPRGHYGLTRGRPIIIVTRPLLRSLLSNQPLGEVTKQLHVQRKALSFLLEAYPALRAHRARPKRSPKPLACSAPAPDKLLEACKDVVAHYLERFNSVRSPEALRASLGDVCRLIDEKDPGFLRSQLRRFEAAASWRDSLQNRSKDSVRDALYFAVEQFHEERPYCAATTRCVLRRLPTQAFLALAARGRQQTKVLIREVVEQPSQYRRRILQLIMALVADGKTDSALAAAAHFLHHRYSRGHEAQVVSLLGESSLRSRVLF